MRSYPAFLRLEGKPVVVVGGGRVARRKAADLVAGGAAVTVVSPEVCAGLRRDAQRGLLRVESRPFAPDDLEGIFLAVAATDLDAVNREVAAAARARHVLVNVVDSPGDCDFFVPASFARGGLQVAVSTGGACPGLAAQISRDLHAQLPRGLARYAAALGVFRQQLKCRVPSRAQRARIIKQVLSSDIGALFAAGHVRKAEKALAAILEACPAAPAGTSRGKADLPADSSAPAGKVWLVGAGPGDAGLITVKGMACIRTADVIVYDRLCNPELLRQARQTCAFIYAGKRAGQHEMTQRVINALLADRALRGSQVCRLKGGDPFVFGRGGEEALFLRARGIPFEVVPGVTSAFAAPACAGIPVTHRGVASAVQILSGHDDAARSDDPGYWRALAAYGGTLVFMMSLGNVANIADSLIAAGRSPDTAAAIVSHGTLPSQRTVVGSLARIASCAAEARLASPALLVVGSVAALHGILARSSEEAFTEIPLSTEPAAERNDG